MVVPPVPLVPFVATNKCPMVMFPVHGRRGFCTVHVSVHTNSLSPANRVIHGGVICAQTVNPVPQNPIGRCGGGAF